MSSHMTPKHGRVFKSVFVSKSHSIAIIVMNLTLIKYKTSTNIL